MIIPYINYSMWLGGILRKISEKKPVDREVNSYWLRQMEVLCKLDKDGLFRVDYDKSQVFMDDRLACQFIADNKKWENFLFRISVYIFFNRALKGVKQDATSTDFDYYILSKGGIVSAFGLYKHGKSVLSASD